MPQKKCAKGLGDKLRDKKTTQAHTQNIDLKYAFELMFLAMFVCA